MAGSRAAEWRRLVRQWERSGLSAPQFAAQQGVAPKTLIWWRWRFRSEEKAAQQERARAKRAAEREQARKDAPVAMVRVVAVEPTAPATAATEPPVELVVGDVLVRVWRGFDAETLGRVIDVLEGQESRTC